VRTQIGHGARAGQGHGYAHVARDEVEQLAHARATARGQGIDESAAQHHRIRPAGQHAHHIEPGAHAGIGQDAQVSRHGIGHARQGRHRRQRAV
jgi:hypothetical protein